MNIYHIYSLIGVVCISPYTPCRSFFPEELLRHKIDGPSLIEKALRKRHKQSLDAFLAIPEDVREETKRLYEKIKSTSADTREWYQKKRYWTLIVTATACGGAAGGYGAAKLVALANASQATAAIVSGVAGTTTAAATCAVTIYLLKYKYKGYRIKISEDGTSIKKMIEEKTHV